MHHCPNWCLVILFGVTLIVGPALDADVESPNVLFIPIDDLRPDPPSATVSFEQCKSGRFEKLNTAIGTWTTTAGATLIDDGHSKTGKQCLQLSGGKQTSVTLDLAGDVDTTGSLNFWAERWTQRDPFQFRVDKYTTDGWEEVFNGDDEVRVGRAFLSQIKVSLGDDRIKRLRFTAKSPPNTGILIDDLRITPARPQKIASVNVVPFTLPALVGNDSSPMLRLRIETTGQLDPVSISEIQATLEGTTDRSDIASLQLLHIVRPENPAGSDEPVMQLESGELGAKHVVFTPSGSSCLLKEGTNEFWIACRLDKQANIDHYVGAACQQISFSNGEVLKLDAAASIQRMGVAVKHGGDHGVHTYRIPGMATTNKGTLIGVYDVRHRTGGDLPGDIDVGMSRSTDGGQTWEPLRVIMDMGDDPSWEYDGVGDPAVLVDRKTGTIWVAATWSHGGRSWNGSGPGLTPEETGQLMLVRSEDDGVTWSQPINITSQVKKPEWCFLLQGPGKGITMRDGTLVFAAQYQDPPEQHRLPHSTIIYSKDHGTTWQVGTGAFDDTTESQVVEIEPGVLMLNCRYNRLGARVVMTTRDMGQTWHKHATSERSLIEPRACMASLIDVDQETGTDEAGWLLFSNPDSTRGRNKITIKASPDRGLTWPKEHRLLLDQGDSAGYSCMSMIDEDTVGILYEGSQAQMTFQRVRLSDLIGENEPAERPERELPKECLKLPRVFGSHMVLQANAEIPVWGHAKSGADVKVTLGEISRIAEANGSGEWSVRFPKRNATAEPLVMTIESRAERIELANVLVGEVWVCAGQSNMEWSLHQSANGAGELSQADRPQIRLLHLAGGAGGSSGSYTRDQLARLTPETYCVGKWAVASAESARDFSAVAWYFGRELQSELKVPVGLICAAVGGTPAESWIPRQALMRDPNLKQIVAGNWLDNERLGRFCRARGGQNLLAAIEAGERIPGDEFGPNHPFKPGFMWDSGIEPLIPYAIRGAIWYQGESNAETPARVQEHGRLFPVLVDQWRDRWEQGEFPFLYVQLPALNRPEWPLFRDGQRRLLEQIQNVGMAITIDMGHPSNVHPSRKKPVGQRLAKWALGTTYESAPNAILSGPLFDSAERQTDSIRVAFRHVGNGLKSSDEQSLRYFEISGVDRVFRPANAKIIDRNTVEISNADILEPCDVRYAWLPFPDVPVNAINSAGMPMSPFTTESAETLYTRRTAASDRPNILLIVSEDNGDHLGCYGEKRVHTPNLDALAENGIRYTRSYVPYSVCSPSRAAFLTGFYPRQTGHIGLATHRFSMYRDFKTMPAYFHQAGYYTGFLGKTHVNPERLVEDFIDHRAIKNSNFGKTTSIESYAQEAGAVMQQAAKEDQPFLLIINYADAHRNFVARSKHGFPTIKVVDPIAPFPWIGSDTPHLREELRDYFNCINRLDEGVGMVIGQLDDTGNRDNTLVIYISDHGADFPRGKGSIYENGTRIPMIVNYPNNLRGRPTGLVATDLVSTLDILPTMLRAGGVPVPANLPGMALQDVGTGSPWSRKYIHTFTTGSAPNLLYMQFGIRDDRYKLVYNPDRAINRLAVSRYRNSELPVDQYVPSFLQPPEYELFDLEEDPHEWTNLADSAAHLSIRQRLLQSMQDFQDQIKDPFANRDNIESFISEQREYENKPYKRPGFRWPHLDMFKSGEKGHLILDADEH